MDLILNLQSVLADFEKEMFSETRGFEIAEVGEFELFAKDEDNFYGLQFQREEKTYSIVIEEFEENGGGWDDTIYLETYPMELYNREFITSRIVYYIAEKIKNYSQNSI